MIRVVKPSNNVPLVLTLRMCGAVPPFLHTSTWHSANEANLIIAMP